MTSPREERIDDSVLAFQMALRGLQREMWTALPGEIVSYDPSKMTCSVKPTIKCRVTKPDNSEEWVVITVLVDCPVVFPRGGGFLLTFPLKEGDECLIVLASRCIDAWWQSGGPQIPPDLRMHDLSDGFVIPGPTSQPKKPAEDPVVDGVELRDDGRTCYVRIDELGNVHVNASNNVQVEAGGDVYVNAGGDLSAAIAGSATVTAGAATISAPTISLTGNVTVTGNLSVTGTMINDGVNIGKTHKHQGGNGGVGLTGNPQ